MSAATLLPLSIVVVCYEMGRELPRTLLSLSPRYQGLSRDEYEVVVVDNGSAVPPVVEDFAELDLQLRIECTSAATPSPVPAMNRALGLARGGLVGAWIDGARMASPGLLRNALRVSRCSLNPVVATLGFHLGPDVQMRSVLAGYDHAAEDALLQRISWPRDGYKLFEISSFAGSSANGWFAPIAESNALFLKAEAWRALGGFDEGFRTPGGGFCNLDMYKRACGQEDADLFVLVGEGTFHQVHGGIATNHPSPPHKEFRREYLELRGEAYVPPSRVPTYFGNLDAAVLPSIEWSARRRDTQSSDGSLKVAERDFRVDVSASTLESIQGGVLRTRYRGVPFLKSPFDVVLYLQLIQRLRPRTIIELGLKFGGSALWFADQQDAHGLRGNVVSVDLEPQCSLNDPRIHVHCGDVRELASVFSDAYLEQLPRPWLVVEDSAHTEEACTAVLEFFSPKLRSGEYLVIEDGVVASLPGDHYRSFNQGPNRAVAGFCNRHPGVFEVDEQLCDHFGVNLTYNPNGWLRRL